MSRPATDPDYDLFGFQLEEDGWMAQLSQLCAADELDENGTVRWRTWLESRPAGLDGPASAD